MGEPVGRHAGADGEYEVGVAEELFGRLAADAQRQGMVFGKGALAFSVVITGIRARSTN